MDNKFIRSLAVGLVAIIFLVTFHYLGWLGPIENLTVKAISPAPRLTYRLASSLKIFYLSWLTKRDLLALNKKLTDDLKNQQIYESKIKSLEEENLLLKKELRFAQENKYNLVSAKIISGVANPASNSVVINRGQKDGVQEGLAVVVEGGVLIGKVFEVHDEYSKVLLLNDNRSRVAATVQNSDRTAGLIEGQFGLSFAMTDIPQDQEIKEGDLVVTSGLEGRIPRGLLIAEIESISQKENDIFKTALLKPIVSFANLSYVLVVAP